MECNVQSVTAKLYSALERFTWPVSWNEDGTKVIVYRYGGKKFNPHLALLPMKTKMLLWELNNAGFTCKLASEGGRGKFHYECYHPNFTRDNPYAFFLDQPPKVSQVTRGRHTLVEGQVDVVDLSAPIGEEGGDLQVFGSWEDFEKSLTNRDELVVQSKASDGKISSVVAGIVIPECPGNFGDLSSGDIAQDVAHCGNTDTRMIPSRENIPTYSSDRKISSVVAGIVIPECPGNFGDLSSGDITQYVAHDGNTDTRMTPPRENIPTYSGDTEVYSISESIMSGDGFVCSQPQSCTIPDDHVNCDRYDEVIGPFRSDGTSINECDATANGNPVVITELGQYQIPSGDELVPDEATFQTVNSEEQNADSLMMIPTHFHTMSDELSGITDKDNLCEACEFRSGLGDLKKGLDLCINGHHHENDFQINTEQQNRDVIINSSCSCVPSGVDQVINYLEKNKDTYFIENDPNKGNTTEDTNNNNETNTEDNDSNNDTHKDTDTKETDINRETNADDISTNKETHNELVSVCDDQQSGKTTRQNLTLIFNTVATNDYVDILEPASAVNVIQPIPLTAVADAGHHQRQSTMIASDSVKGPRLNCSRYGIEDWWCTSEDLDTSVECLYDSDEETSLNLSDTPTGMLTPVVDKLSQSKRSQSESPVMLTSVVGKLSQSKISQSESPVMLTPAMDSLSHRKRCQSESLTVRKTPVVDTKRISYESPTVRLTSIVDTTAPGKQIQHVIRGNIIPIEATQTPSPAARRLPFIDTNNIIQSEMPVKLTLGVNTTKRVQPGTPVRLIPILDNQSHGKGILCESPTVRPMPGLNTPIQGKLIQYVIRGNSMSPTITTQTLYKKIPVKIIAPKQRLGKTEARYIQSPYDVSTLSQCQTYETVPQVRSTQQLLYNQTDQFQQQPIPLSKSTIQHKVLQEDRSNESSKNSEKQMFQRTKVQQSTEQYRVVQGELANESANNLEKLKFQRIKTEPSTKHYNVFHIDIPKLSSGNLEKQLLQTSKSQQEAMTKHPAFEQTKKTDAKDAEVNDVIKNSNTFSMGCGKQNSTALHQIKLPSKSVAPKPLVWIPFVWTPDGKYSCNAPGLPKPVIGVMPETPPTSSTTWAATQSANHCLRKFSFFSFEGEYISIITAMQCCNVNY